MRRVGGATITIIYTKGADPRRCRSLGQSRTRRQGDFLLTNARAARVEVAIEDGRFWYLDVFINNVGAALPEVEETGVQELTA
jgi:hypothetical protein